MSDVKPAAPVQLESEVQPPAGDRLPPFKVILHNDDKNEPLYVVETICDLTPLNPHTATNAMLEAHNTGAALLLVTHRERAELYIEQFQSKRLSVSMEPAE
jgi:ATP-dependent Clp protease adaptor protein ClpS